MPDKLLSMSLAEAMETVRIIILCSLLLAASAIDIRTRTIPDMIGLLIAAISLIPPEPVRMAGVLAALPLLIAGLSVGGIGGGDIKLTGACGMVLGLERTFMGLLAGLILMLAFHGMKMILKSSRKNGKEQAYPLVPFLTAGMLLYIV